MTRNPSKDQNPLDRASFYVEALKFGPKPGTVEPGSEADMVGELEVLLRDANVTSMTGQQLWDAAMYYGESFHEQMGLPFVICLSLWLDGLMHGIAFGAGLKGEHRNPKGS